MTSSTSCPRLRHVAQPEEYRRCTPAPADDDRAVLWGLWHAVRRPPGRRDDAILTRCDSPPAKPLQGVRAKRGLAAHALPGLWLSGKPYRLYPDVDVPTSQPCATS